jgi:hypothetical protein
MDFFRIVTEDGRGGVVKVRPDLVVGRSQDLMVRGQSFYAIWDEEAGLWSTNEYDVVRVVDGAILKHCDELQGDGTIVKAQIFGSFDTKRWSNFKQFIKSLSDNYKQLDTSLTFANTVVEKKDYVSKRLPYSLMAGGYAAWDELLGTLYSPEERAKIEWAIGAVISGDSKRIEKFLVFYGRGGTGKSTVMKIIEELFQGYVKMFEAKALVGNNNNFATAVFKDNPLVAIQHDGDLSKIDDNTAINSIVGHDKMVVNEKFMAGYELKINAFLFMGTNKPVRITDAKSGLIRRLIVVNPTGNTIEPNRYFQLMEQVQFELGAIAYHCLETYKSMGKNFYNLYKPLEMMNQTDMFFNFIEEVYDVFRNQDGVKLKQAYAMYKEYCTEAELEYRLNLARFREELKNYFETFEDRTVVDGVQVRSYYSGFKPARNEPVSEVIQLDAEPYVNSMAMDKTVSLLDDVLAAYPAQYGTVADTPSQKWDDVKTTLADIDTAKVHFVKVPETHIVIDFDLRGEDGQKSRDANLETAAMWPPTYAEFSKSGGGVHLHYDYVGGDPAKLAAVYADGIEVKVYRGGGSLRRKLIACNDIPIATINSGLPLKEGKKVLEQKTIRSERALRELIQRNINREIHSSTKSSVDFIKKILDDAYKSGMMYDLTDMRGRIMAFANNSSNQSEECLKTFLQMKFKTDDSLKEHVAKTKDERLVFFDVEVFPNLFIICYKRRGIDGVHRMINPTPNEVEELFGLRLIGFNNRDYDNHILWARYMGATNQQLYELSQRIIVHKDHNAKFGEAYNLSFADVLDFSSERMGLKKWEIKLGIFHKELNFPWDEPVDIVDWEEVAEYCDNDVIALEAVFEDRYQDFVARQIMADLSGHTVNDTTRKHAERIVFGNEKHPQRQFVWTDLTEMFPGYTFDPYEKINKSMYRGKVVGEGGYVYAEPGMYTNVALLDVASMHPTSIQELNYFGPYTENFVALTNARLAIKEKRFDDARAMFDGRLAPYLTNEADAKGLEKALKLVINSVYGLTMAKFPNLFRWDKNNENIVAKRGALFMIELLMSLQEKGIQVVHIKTDSVKIPNATPEIIDMIKEFGADYGYTFNHEATYEKFCLVNDAVYIAYVGWNDKGLPPHWSATGAQFQVPYVFKTLFSGEPIQFEDLCVTNEVRKGAMYLDFDAIDNPLFGYEGDHFVGKVGRFVPIAEHKGGGKLVVLRDGKKTSVSGTKGFFFVEADLAKFRIDNDIELGTRFEDDTIDFEYFNRMVQAAVDTMAQYGNVNEFIGVDKELMVA